jgi:hypothetical protein
LIPGGVTPEGHLPGHPVEYGYLKLITGTLKSKGPWAVSPGEKYFCVETGPIAHGNECLMDIAQFMVDRAYPTETVF